MGNLLHEFVLDESKDVRSVRAMGLEAVGEICVL